MSSALPTTSGNNRVCEPISETGSLFKIQPIVWDLSQEGNHDSNKKSNSSLLLNKEVNSDRMAESGSSSTRFPVNRAKGSFGQDTGVTKNSKQDSTNFQSRHSDAPSRDMKKNVRRSEKWSYGTVEPHESELTPPLSKPVASSYVKKYETSRGKFPENRALRVVKVIPRIQSMDPEHGQTKSSTSIEELSSGQTCHEHQSGLESQSAEDSPSKRHDASKASNANYEILTQEQIAYFCQKIGSTDPEIFADQLRAEILQAVHSTHHDKKTIATGSTAVTQRPRATLREPVVRDRVYSSAHEINVIEKETQLQPKIHSQLDTVLSLSDTMKAQYASSIPIPLRSDVTAKSNAVSLSNFDIDVKDADSQHAIESINETVFSSDSKLLQDERRSKQSITEALDTFNASDEYNNDSNYESTDKVSEHVNSERDYSDASESERCVSSQDEYCSSSPPYSRENVAFAAPSSLDVSMASNSPIYDDSPVEVEDTSGYIGHSETAETRDNFNHDVEDKSDQYECDPAFEKRPERSRDNQIQISSEIHNQNEECRGENIQGSECASLNSSESRELQNRRRVSSSRNRGFSSQSDKSDKEKGQEVPQKHWYHKEVYNRKAGHAMRESGVEGRYRVEARDNQNRLRRHEPLSPYTGENQKYSNAPQRGRYSDHQDSYHQKYDLPQKRPISPNHDMEFSRFSNRQSSAEFSKPSYNNRMDRFSGAPRQREERSRFDSPGGPRRYVEGSQMNMGYRVGMRRSRSPVRTRRDIVPHHDSPDMIRPRPPTSGVRDDRRYVSSDKNIAMRSRVDKPSKGAYINRTLDGQRDYNMPRQSNFSSSQGTYWQPREDDRPELMRNSMTKGPPMNRGMGSSFEGPVSKRSYSGNVDGHPSSANVAMPPQKRALTKSMPDSDMRGDDFARDRQMNRYDGAGWETVIQHKDSTNCSCVIRTGLFDTPNGWYDLCRSALAFQSGSMNDVDSNSGRRPELNTAWFLVRGCRCEFGSRRSYKTFDPSIFPSWLINIKRKVENWLGVRNHHYTVASIHSNPVSAVTEFSDIPNVILKSMNADFSSVMLSIGASRRIEFRQVDRDSTGELAVRRIRVRNGDMLKFSGGFLDRWTPTVSGFTQDEDRDSNSTAGNIMICFWQMQHGRDCYTGGRAFKSKMMGNPNSNLSGNGGEGHSSQSYPHIPSYRNMRES